MEVLGEEAGEEGDDLCRGHDRHRPEEGIRLRDLVSWCRPL